MKHSDVLNETLKLEWTQTGAAIKGALQDFQPSLGHGPPVCYNNRLRERFLQQQ